ncbi:MAG: DNA pilot protein [Microvirus sp.]|nr:MAG: DNA pilot protein [Microvirus sp.]
MSWWTQIRDAGLGVIKKGAPELADWLLPGTGAGTAVSAGIQGLDAMFSNKSPSPSSAQALRDEGEQKVQYDPQTPPLKLDVPYGQEFGSPDPSFAGGFELQTTGTKPPFDWMGALGAVSPAIAGGITAYGQQRTNVANAQQAQKQMDFQASQTGTAYQRGTADMAAAGLNPMLAYSQGGASSGGGAQATLGNVGGSGVNSALDAASRAAQIGQARATTENIGYDSDAKIYQPELVKAQTLRELASASQSNATARSVDKGIEKQLLDIEHSRLGLAESRANESYYKAGGGWLKGIEKALGPIANSARTVYQLGRGRLGH